LFRGHRVAGLLKKTGLDLIEVGIHRRIERIEIFAESQTVELIAPLQNCLSNGSSDAATFVAQKREQTDRGAAKLRRNIQERGNVERSKNGGKAHDEHDARPDNLPGTDLQVQSRHPITLRDVRVLRDHLLSHEDWDVASRAYAREHDRYFGVVHTVEGWFTEMFHETEPASDARRAQALPLIAQDPTRRPDVFFSGPDYLLDETARRRFFGEE
jgi:hypothetical protein